MKDLHALISTENGEIRTPENTTSDDSIMSKKSVSVILNKKLNGNGIGNGSNVGEFYDEKRIPSYTDRVLFKSLPAFTQNLKLISFQSCEDVPSSDHKPVVTAFTVKTTDGGHSIVLNTAGDGAVFDLFEMKGINLAEMDTVLGQAGKYSLCVRLCGVYFIIFIFMFYLFFCACFYTYYYVFSNFLLTNMYLNSKCSCSMYGLCRYIDSL
jgi:hypothetical protein